MRSEQDWVGTSASQLTADNAIKKSRWRVAMFDLFAAFTPAGLSFVLWVWMAVCDHGVANAPALNDKAVDVIPVLLVALAIERGGVLPPEAFWVEVCHWEPQKAARLSRTFPMWLARSLPLATLSIAEALLIYNIGTGDTVIGLEPGVSASLMLGFTALVFAGFRHTILVSVPPDALKHPA